MPAKWIQAELTTSAHCAEDIAAALCDLGALSVTLSEAPGADPILEPAPGATPLWPEVIVSALFPSDTQREVVAAISAWTGTARQQIRISSLEERDWIREFRQNLAPQCFGDRLWICPAGIAPPDARDVALTLEPGLAFGTGSHPTTALCLEWLAATDLEGSSVLDWGCGSGILGLAALRLGAHRVTAVDIDPQALAATTENARLNNLGDRLRILQPGELSGAGSYDVVMANILAGTILELAPVLGRQCAPAARVALSGILGRQAAQLCEGCRPWLNLCVAAEREEWVLLSGGPAR